jgi:hypothetical protein
MIRLILIRRREKGSALLPSSFSLFLVLVSSPAALSAQIPFDSLPPDSLLRDTVNTTERYLEAQKASRIRLPVLPLIGTEGPRPAMSRIVLTRDSLEWGLAETVSDLLQRTPGLYLWRGGWLGRTEYPNYRGRGATSVEYLVDGLPHVPMGPDSVGVDPSLFSLSLYDRIEIERWPGLLRVHLFTPRHDLQAPGSRVGIASGDKEVARYIGSLERRFASGIGFAVGGERMVAPTATGTSSDFDATTIWLQLGFVPSTRFGLQAQLINSSPDRKAFVESPDTLELPTSGKRSDAQFRLFWRNRADGLGLRVDGLVGRTAWKGTGVDDELRQGGLVLGWRSRTVGVSVRGFNRSRITPWDLRGRAGWAPASVLTMELESGYQAHDGDRQSRWIAGRAGLSLPLGLEVQGTIRSGSIVVAPALVADRAQSLTDWQAGLKWDRPWAGVEVGYGRTAPFRPAAYRSFSPTVPALASAPRTNWVTVGWRLAPKQWFTLEGWYSDPTGNATPDGVPATHSLTSATIRSKFWRTFRSGIFDFKAQLAYESWGDGIIGRDSLGAPIALDGASFWRTEIEIRLDSFILYWDRYNLQASRKSYVPGFRLLNFGSTFGVKWEFTN